MTKLTDLSNFRSPTRQEQIQISEYLLETVQKSLQFIFMAIEIWAVISIFIAIFFRDTNIIIRIALLLIAFFLFFKFCSDQSQQISSLRRIIAFYDFEVLDCKIVYLYQSFGKIFVYFETKDDKCSDPMPVKAESENIPEHVLLIKYGKEFELLIPGARKRQVVPAAAE